MDAQAQETASGDVPSLSGLLDGVTTALTDAGFGLLAPFVVTPELCELFPFPRLGVRSPLGVLVANDRRLWAHVEARILAADSPHPLDSYVESTLESVLANAALKHVEHAVFLGWRTGYTGHNLKPTAIPLQRLAQAIGFAALGPAHLSVHPSVGPWLGLRAVLIFGVEAQGYVPEPVARVEPCASCHQPCCAPFEIARAQGASTPEPWRAWLAVRDACPVAREARYDEPQIRYHYTRAFASASKP